MFQSFWVLLVRFSSFWYLLGGRRYWDIKGTMKMDKKWIDVVAWGILRFWLQTLQNLCCVHCTVCQTSWQPKKNSETKSSGLLTKRGSSWRHPNFWPQAPQQLGLPNASICETIAMDTCPGSHIWGLPQLSISKVRKKRRWLKASQRQLARIS